MATTSFTNPRCFLREFAPGFLHLRRERLNAALDGLRSKRRRPFIGPPVREQAFELSGRWRCDWHGPDIVRPKRAVLVLQEPREWQFPEDEVLRPAGFSRQCEDEARRPHRLDQFGGGVASFLLPVGRVTTSICAASMAVRLFSRLHRREHRGHRQFSSKAADLILERLAVSRARLHGFLHHRAAAIG